MGSTDVHDEPVVGIPHREPGQGLGIVQLTRLRSSLGEGPRASNALLLELATAVEQCRTHDHRGDEDLFCGNLLGWIGERIGPVLRRLADADEALTPQHGEPDLLRIAADYVTSGVRHGSPSMIRRRLRQEHHVHLSVDGADRIMAGLYSAGIVGPYDPDRGEHPVLLTQAQATTALGAYRRTGTAAQAIDAAAPN